MVYGGTYYAFEKNTLGDIIGIKNMATGEEVASYSYDAWGNIIAKSGSLADVNPFRYRGYYYDTETGFYYLQTRYYDPETMRFINADDYELLDTLMSTIGQLNFYAYCNNNPISFTDPSGEIILTLVTAFVIGATLSAVGSIAVQLVTTRDVDWGQVGLSALFGGVGGLVAVTGYGGALGQFVMQGILAVGQSVTEIAINGTWSQITAEGLILDFIVAGAIGTIGAKSAASEFRRMTQIEKSLTQVLKRDFAKNGVKGFVRTFANKSRKFMKDVVWENTKDAALGQVLSVASYFMIG